MTSLSRANLNNGAAVGPQSEGRESPITFPAYPAYKDSGVEWAGALPVQWQTLKLKRAARLQSGEFITSEAIEDDAQYPVYGGNGLRGYTVAYTHEGEYALIGRQGALCGNINYAEGKFWASEHAVVVYPETGIVTRWLGELLRSMSLGQYSVSAAQPGLSVERIADLLIPVPTQAEQTQIARFLDHETARIDALIEEQQRLIELLKEKRHVVISHAVTKGLDPTVPMKDSGVKWLGDVPAHWEVLATKRFFRMVADPAPNDNDYELLSVYTEIGVRPRKELEQKGNKASTTDGYWRVKKGDLIVNKLLAWMGAVGYSDYDGVTSPAYDILRSSRQLSPKFYHYIFRGKPAQQEFKRWSRGIMEMRLRLYFDELGRISMPFPPLGEQEKIVAFIEAMETKFESLSYEASEQVRLLSERRAALISAAVTGKIDVRGWQPPASAQATVLEAEGV